MKQAQAPRRMMPSGKIGPFIVLGDGSLLSIYVEGRKSAEWRKLDVAQHLLLRRSSDGGRTWSEPEAIVSHPEQGALALGYALFADAAGRIHQLYLVLFDWEEHLPYAERKIEMRAITSTDEGRTWSKPRLIDYGHSYTGSINAVTVLGSGRIVVPFSYLSQRQTGCFVSTAIYSDDHGESWRRADSDLALDNGGSESESGAVEPVTVELPDGRVWMVIRTQAGKLYESYSADGGTTWSAPSPTAFVSSNAPAGLLRLKDGSIVMVWNHCNGEPFRGGISYARQSLVAAIRGADGTWRGYREIVGMRRGDDDDQLYCYPWMAELEDGGVLVGYYDVHLARFEQSLVFRTVRFDPAWLAEPEAALGKELYGEEQFAQVAATQAGVDMAPGREGAGALRLNVEENGPSAGVTWNFPLLAKGELAIKLRTGNRFAGAYLTLAESFLLPGNRQAGLFRMRIEPEGGLSVQRANEGPYLPLPGKKPAAVAGANGAAAADAGGWREFVIGWDCTRELASLRANGAFAGMLPQLERGGGVSYVRFHLEAEGELLIESLRSIAPAGQKEGELRQ
ncbi:sialidase family protein [Paenibacillus cymbidii]|uniref:sialidase family protein n=1 Tax=Paenibacillus cymbidii TaxID=1639034 RepID=UPI00108146B5|nr:sialidase family protein [Paenibacillus cymbidii]